MASPRKQAPEDNSNPASWTCDKLRSEIASLGMKLTSTAVPKSALIQMYKHLLVSNKTSAHETSKTDIDDGLNEMDDNEQSGSGSLQSNSMATASSSSVEVQGNAGNVAVLQHTLGMLSSIQSTISTLQSTISTVLLKQLPEGSRNQLENLCKDSSQSSGFEYLDGSKYSPVIITEDSLGPIKTKDHACQYCAKMFLSKSHLRQHERIHTGEKPYKCDQCEMAFNQRGTLNTHYRIHTGERPFKCEYCDKAFVSRAPLNYHVSKNHADELDE